MRNALRRAWCWLRGGHRWEDLGAPQPQGYTTAPYPAIDEMMQGQRCVRCPTYRSVFAGFVMEVDR